MPQKSALTVRSLPPVIWVIALICAWYAICAPGFFSLNNLYNIGIQAAPLLIIAIGTTMIILTEGIDLSPGNILSLSGVCLALLLQRGVPFFYSVLLSILAGGVCGLGNGWLVARLKLPPFITTLGMGSVITGVGLVLTGGLSIPARDPALEFIASGAIFGLKLPILIALLAFGIIWVLMHQTPYGRNVVGLGGNAEALRLAGVRTERALTHVYIVAGLLAGLSGVVVAARMASGHIAAGVGWDFDAVAATIIGGTSFEEGKGGIANTVLGVILIAVLRNGLNVAGIPNMYQFAIIGLVVLGAIILDTVVRRFARTGEVC